MIFIRLAGVGAKSLRIRTQKSIKGSRRKPETTQLSELHDQLSRDSKGPLRKGSKKMNRKKRVEFNQEGQVNQHCQAEPQTGSRLGKESEGLRTGRRLIG